MHTEQSDSLVEKCTLSPNMDFGARYTMTSEGGTYKFSFFCEICDEGYTTGSIAADSVEKALILAAKEARIHFNGCGRCGKWVCDHHYNMEKALCIECMPLDVNSSQNDYLKKLEENRMSSDLFKGLGNVLGSIAKSVIPQDTPEGKLLTAQSELSDLKKQESDIFLEIGRQAYDRDPSAWPQDAKMKLIQQNIAIAQARLEEAQATQEEAETAKAAEDAKGRCPNCGHKNTEGVKFCQECGSPLAAVGPRHCTSCGAEIAPGTRFCGECGANQGE